jgi:hypothetical protein
MHTIIAINIHTLQEDEERLFRKENDYEGPSNTHYIVYRCNGRLFKASILGQIRKQYRIKSPSVPECESWPGERLAILELELSNNYL